jgi:predicted secreted hydrolase
MMLLALFLTFAVARPGYQYQFPRDHFAHPEFRTEWWYWTGNLRTSDGRRFGFELTFFRNATTEKRERDNPWEVTDLYLAHLALSDIGGRRFYHHERVNRAGPGLAGADASAGRIWNGNWNGGLDELDAVTADFRLRLRFRTDKPPVIHGENGLSRKSACGGCASHYVSFTRLFASGELTLGGDRLEVEGTAWMDHEFFTHQLEADQVGWDWLSVQLDGGEELMLFQLRRRDGSLDPFSSGTYVDSKGRTRHLRREDFVLTPGRQWKSSSSGASYPIQWRIQVPSLELELEATTPMQNQELIGRSSYSPTYWEGAMDYSGLKDGRPIRGVGYLEMTGYDKPIKLGGPQR